MSTILSFGDFISSHTESSIEEGRFDKFPETGIINRSTLELNQRTAEDIHFDGIIDVVKELLIYGFKIQYHPVYAEYKVSNWGGVKFEEMKNYKKEHYPRIPHCFYSGKDPLPLYTDLNVDSSEFDEALV